MSQRAPSLRSSRAGSSDRGSTKGSSETRSRVKQLEHTLASERAARIAAEERLRALGDARPPDDRGKQEVEERLGRLASAVRTIIGADADKLLRRLDCMPPPAPAVGSRQHQLHGDQEKSFLDFLGDETDGLSGRSCRTGYRLDHNGQVRWGR
eukprot:TRINITY_DN23173_c0_g2_i1.p1 TRINITY_DN23173_c0_g2~~TRINITY_DN23173_c0_g2_i1.p1  ORF type:complete len:179 (+),score=60.45 TRINITY_DN23173_c0_g2_i1:81-539(+)